jgi:hypothetical protein
MQRGVFSIVVFALTVLALKALADDTKRFRSLVAPTADVHFHSRSGDARPGSGGDLEIRQNEEFPSPAKPAQR